MHTYNLAYGFSWSCLPWKRIQERILILQTKIYKASQECNQCKLKYYQYILLNSIEVKIKAIQDTSKFIYQYYSKYSKEKYCFDDLEKSKILLTLFSEKKTYSKLIIDKVEQNIVINSIKPEWTAKLENYTLKKMYHFADRVFLYSEEYSKTNIKFNTFKSSFCVKHIDTKYLLCKMQSISLINNKIKAWITSQSILKSYDLYKYIYYIIFSGIEWFSLTKLMLYMKEYNKITEYSLYLIKQKVCLVLYSTKALQKVFIDYSFLFRAIGFIIKSSYKIINYIKYISEIKYSLLQNCFNKVKSSLYNKDFLNRVRPITQINIVKVAYTVKQSLIDLYNNYSRYLTTEELTKLSNKISVLLLVWLRKKYTNKLLAKKKLFTIIKLVGRSRMK